MVLCRNTQSREFLPDHVGRCDRENSCGYHYSWKDYYKQQGKEQKPFIAIREPEPQKPVDFLNISYLQRAIGAKFHSLNNFYQYLERSYTRGPALEAFCRYCIGTSKIWRGATVFPQIDENGNLRQLKAILYNPIKGKRIKAGEVVERYDNKTKSYQMETAEKGCSKIYGKWIDENTKALNLEQCFFGAHLLTEYPDKIIGVVESEKTAVIASIHYPEYIFLATGGASGCRWREYATYKVLQGRSVVFFPDHGLYNKTTCITCYEEWKQRAERITEVLPGTKIKVSNLLENFYKGEPREDQDLADLLTQNIDESTGLVLTNSPFAYPFVFDLKNELN